jgi:hypothetical protein
MTFFEIGLTPLPERLVFQVRAAESRRPDLNLSMVMIPEPSS